MKAHLEEAEQPQERINWLKRVGGILVSPGATLEEVAKRPDWVIPCIFLLIWPVFFALIYSSSLTGGMILGLAIDLAIMAGLWAVESGVIWSFGRTPGGGTRFYAVLSVLGYAFFPMFVMGMLGTVLRLSETLYLLYGKLWINTTLSFHLRRMGMLRTLYSGSPTWVITWSAIIDSIEIFNLWSFCLVLLGIRSVFGFGVWRAAAFTFLYWIVYVTFFIIVKLMMF